jgi:hypothetical protein
MRNWWEMRKLLRFLYKCQHGQSNKIRSFELESEMARLGIGPGALRSAMMRGFVGIEPSHTNYVMLARSFHWYWITEKGADYMSGERLIALLGGVAGRLLSHVPGL